MRHHCNLTCIHVKTRDVITTWHYTTWQRLKLTHILNSGIQLNLATSDNNRLIGSEMLYSYLEVAASSRIAYHLYNLQKEIDYDSTSVFNFRFKGNTNQIKIQNAINLIFGWGGVHDIWCMHILVWIFAFITCIAVKRRTKYSLSGLETRSGQSGYKREST